MEDGIQTKFSGNQDEIKRLIKHIENEYLLLKLSDWKSNELDDGVHLYVAVIAKQAVLGIEH
jgi:two-component SAPR family response regulator